MQRLRNWVNPERQDRSGSRWGLKYHQRLAFTGFLFATPALLLLLIFSAYPMASAFNVSLTNYDLMSEPEYIGLQNYERLLTDPNFKQTIGVTAKYILMYAPLVALFSFVIALLLKPDFKGRTFFRTLFFAPSVLSLVGMSVVWRIMLNPQGPINALLGIKINWLMNSAAALPGIVTMEVWRNMGFYAIMFLVGMQAIPMEYYEAARIDGANAWQLLKRITLPLLRPTFALVFVITMISSLKIFTPMFVMTQGGPANATRSVVMLIYRTALKHLEMGYASAQSVILFSVILVFSFLQLRLFRVGREI